VVLRELQSIAQTTGGHMTKQEFLLWVEDHQDWFPKCSTKWFDDNWHIVLEFIEQAYEMKKKYRSHYSARDILHYIRHRSVLVEVGGQGYKINNDVSPDLARACVVMHREFLNFWEYRRHDWQAFKTMIENLPT
jgi:hypothetical protein